MTEENQEKSNNLETESKKFRDIQEHDDWKAAHLADKKEVEMHRDAWKKKCREAEKKVVDLSKKNLKLMEEIESMERDDISRKKITGQDEVELAQKKAKERQLNKFLSKIK